MEEADQPSQLLTSLCEKYLRHANVSGIGICRDTPVHGGLYLVVFVKDRDNLDFLPRFHQDTPVVAIDCEGREIPRVS